MELGGRPKHFPDILGNIFAFPPIPPGGRLDQPAVFIGKTHREAVQLGLRHIQNFTLPDIQEFPDPAVKVDYGLILERIAQGPHGYGMLHFGKGFCRIAPHFSGGRVIGLVLGKFSLQFRQLTE